MRQSADHLDRLERAYSALTLKTRPRAGWVDHGVPSPESVADHSWGTAYLCLLFADEAGVDPLLSAAIAVVHDVAEAVTGDFATRPDPRTRSHTPTEKRALELSAMLELTSENSPVRELWNAYETRSSPEARFVRDMNLIDMCLQALRYEKERLPHSPGGARPEAGWLREFVTTVPARLSGELALKLHATVLAWYEEAIREP